MPGGAQRKAAGGAAAGSRPIAQRLTIRRLAARPAADQSGKILHVPCVSTVFVAKKRLVLAVLLPINQHLNNNNNLAGSAHEHELYGSRGDDRQKHTSGFAVPGRLSLSDRKVALRALGGRINAGERAELLRLFYQLHEPARPDAMVTAEARLHDDGAPGHHKSTCQPGCFA